MKESVIAWHDAFLRNEGKIEKQGHGPIVFENDFYHDRWEIIRDIIRSENKEEVSRLLNDSGDIDLIRSFSHLRGNLFSWLEVGPEDKVLVIGEDIYWCAGFLAGAGTTFVTHNIYHLLFIAEKYPDADSRLVYLGNEDFPGVLPDTGYDWVFFSDFVRGRRNDSRLLPVINKIKRCLSDKGKLVFATENPLGMKFWSGCADSLTGSLWSGLEGYAHEDEGYLTLKAIRELITESHFENAEIRYPYPDCWFPTGIYSDSHLPEVGELTKNAFSWEKRLHLFNEVNVWNQLISNNAFRFFSNGYIVILSGPEESGRKVIFSKYSNDREERLSIRTDLLSDKEGGLFVKKRALTSAGWEHISKLPVLEEKLGGIYSDTNIEIQKVYCCKDGVAELEYIKGNTMSSVLKDCLEKDLEEDFVNTFSDFSDILLGKADRDFSPTEGFALVFGEVDVPVGLRCCAVTDIDLIVSNVIIRNGKYGIIDYEWSFDFPIPVNFVIYRSITYLFKGPRGEAAHDLYYRRLLLDKYGIDDDQYALYSQMEKNFQKFICSGHIPLRDILNVESIRDSVIRPVVFPDFGRGFSERNRYRVSFQIFDKDAYRFNLGIMPNLRAIRLDPTDHACVVVIRDIRCVGTENYRPQYETNGIHMGNGVILYDTDDPQIVISDIRYGTEKIEMEIEMTEIPSGASQAIADKCRISEK